MTEPDADVEAILSGIDRARSPRPAAHRRLEEALLADANGARPLPDSLSARLSDRLLSEAGGGGRYGESWFTRLAGVAAAVVLIGAVLGVAIHSRGAPPVPSTAAGPASKARTGTGSGSGGAGGVRRGAQQNPVGGGPTAVAPSPLGAASAPATPGPAASSGGAFNTGSGTVPTTGSAAGAPASGSANAPPPGAAAGAGASLSGPGPPSVASISPSQGPARGGVWVTITGSFLGGTKTVRFGTTGASQVKVDSTGQIRALSPAHLPGSVDVVVVTPEGSSSPTASDRFQYLA